MQNFHDTFETRRRSLINVLSICMTVPLMKRLGILKAKTLQKRMIWLKLQVSG